MAGLHPCSGALDLAPYPTLQTCRHHSLVLVEHLAASLCARAERLTPLAGVIAAGSIGRLEAGLGSDLDCILITPPGSHVPGAVSAAVDEIMAVISAAGLRQPKVHGIYRTPVAIDDLCRASSYGDLSESPEIFGKRMQILLDSRALYGAEVLREARRRILQWYWSASRWSGLDHGWEYLARDLIRYANAYTNWQIFKFARTADDSWLLRQLKLRSSRYATWLGLWLPLVYAERAEIDSLDWLAAQLEATPLERIGACLKVHAPEDFQLFLQCYEQILSALQDGTCREALLRGGPDEAQRNFDWDPIVRRAFDAAQSLRTIVTRCRARHSARNSPAEWVRVMPF